MKIQCSVCEAAEANVLCCADEAALCWSCDSKVHAANKLASKHQRIPLSGPSSPMPMCDICQETVGYFFCLEDRALLCRSCDVAIHKANAHVSAHRRFLLTGVKVGLESTEVLPSSSSQKNSQSGENILEREPRSVSRTSAPGPSNHRNNKVLPAQISGVGDLAPTKQQLGGSATGNISQWQLEEFLGFNDFDQNCSYLDNNSSKADSGKIGGSNCSSVLKVNEQEPGGDECMGQVPEASWAVPQIPSPPTASGLWPKTYRNPLDTSVFVPDVGYTPLPNPYHQQPNSTNSKRQRQY